MSCVVLHLVETDHGRPLQTWTFENRDTITLGRLPDNDVVLADPRVSRSHAYIRRENDQWQLISISQQQLSVRGQLTPEVNLQAGMSFRLGRSGTLLRFEDALHSAVPTQTISVDSLDMPELHLDDTKMQHEVNQIVQASYFRNLKEKARLLREQRLAGANSQDGSQRSS